jgi:hypothetical protein
MYLSLAPAFEVRLQEAMGRAGIDATPRLVWIVLGLGGILGLSQVIIVTVVGGLITHAVARLLGGVADAHRSVACYAVSVIPSGFKAITISVLSLSLDAEDVPLASVGLSSGGERLLALLDPFSLWAMLLLGIGLCKVHGLSSPRAFGITFALFLAGVTASFALASVHSQLG